MTRFYHSYHRLFMPKHEDDHNERIWRRKTRGWVIPKPKPVQYCDRCLPEIFPFNTIVNDREFREALNGFRIEQRHLDKAASLRFNPLDDLIKDTLVDLERTLGGCGYYDEEKYFKMRQDFSEKNGGLLSLLCLNINGL